MNVSLYNPILQFLFQRINKKINKKDKNLRAKEYFQKKNMESMRKRNNFLMKVRL